MVSFYFINNLTNFRIFTLDIARLDILQLSFQGIIQNLFDKEKIFFANSIFELARLDSA
ncbi:hypothetical protein FC62_GL001237 [Amylolactobacillus amylotrophicus DSM 20534]|uniref:Uncharacterized protein n=1 Tax=Amylolactobacillus amylotrophicus DSM 20534 TaxID=1423722 RepID=A0A0R1GUR9_9LACO|nr:hypothetical protein FC62_GL001237 [Amylolactobacillus amylotrophicus DSM 20534]